MLIIEHIERNSWNEEGNEGRERIELVDVRLDHARVDRNSKDRMITRPIPASDLLCMQEVGELRLPIELPEGAVGGLERDVVEDYAFFGDHGVAEAGDVYYSYVAWFCGRGGGEEGGEEELGEVEV